MALCGFGVVLGGVSGFSAGFLGFWRPGLRLERRRHGFVIGLWILASGTNIDSDTGFVTTTSLAGVASCEAQWWVVVRFGAGYDIRNGTSCT